MQMSAGEIRRNYDQAKNKKRQIAILADLNGCTKEEIEEILGVEKKSESAVQKERKMSEVLNLLFGRLDELEGQIQSLEEEYRKVTIAIDVLGKVDVYENVANVI